MARLREHRPAPAPRGAPLSQLAKLAQRCTACPLYARATQAVFGEGPEDARVVFVGEQPGDAEDLAGRPFVGPAGALLWKLAVAAGLDKDDVYVTNAVKHFKWEPSGKRRLHQKPTARELAACRPWLEAELERLHPEVLVLLGASAAQSVLGSGFKLTQHRGELLDVGRWAPFVMATLHPSALLRMPDEAARRAAREEVRRDFVRVRAVLEGRIRHPDGTYTPKPPRLGRATGPA